ncbi:MAG: primosomal protein N' [Cytophagaceae bacterium]|nr:primosomal protein N' [Cytophagaceae bacterium]MDW8456641.1 primosomal protein N' [Cytophagaceae bacterium]
MTKKITGPLIGNKKPISPTDDSEWYAEVLLPLTLDRYYTYYVPEAFQKKIAKGYRVLVPFRGKKIITGVVVELRKQATYDGDIKPIFDLPDEKPCLNEYQLSFIKWIASYYMCTEGEVLKAALPSALKLSSDSKLQLNPAFNKSYYDLKPEEEVLITEIEKRNINISDAAKLLNKKNILPHIKNLLSKNAIIVYEEVREKYIPQKKRMVQLHETYRQDEKMLEHLFTSLEKKNKQTDVLLSYLRLQKKESAERMEAVEKKDLLASGISETALATLIKKNIFIEYEQIVPRFNYPNVVVDPPKLSLAQDRAKAEIISLYDSHSTVLLHGVTGSGKTEIYISLTKDVMSSGHQVLLLVPEIALTTQLVSRLSKYFGATMAVYHSKHSDNERLEVWKGVQDGQYNFIVGVRSSIFLPFNSLGLIIIDEEHEPSYKQYDPAPRYHGRDSAVYLAKLHNCKALLGSATPSLESYYNAQDGKWGYVALNERYANASMPEIVLANTKTLKTHAHHFSPLLLEEIQKKISLKEQIILFQNRRGYAPYLFCEACEFVPQCPNCSVSLTYHMHEKELICHYCGHKENIVQKCKACGNTRVVTKGFGTQKLEEELSLLIPNIQVQRLDYDSTRSKHAYEKIISAFESKTIDVLVGTQMVTKGLDFDNVTLVGVFDIDRMLHYPDFRSTERVLQLLFQVSGRAGRKNKQGKVIIQTDHVQHLIFQYLIQNDLIGFYEQELPERKKFNYPPYSRLISITVKHVEKNIAVSDAEQLAYALRKTIGTSLVIGPQFSLIEKIRNLYFLTLYIKANKESVSSNKVKNQIKEVLGSLLLQSTCIVDVDPM